VKQFDIDVSLLQGFLGLDADHHSMTFVCHSAEFKTSKELED